LTSWRPGWARSGEAGHGGPFFAEGRRFTAPPPPQGHPRPPGGGDGSAGHRAAPECACGPRTEAMEMEKPDRLNLATDLFCGRLAFGMPSRGSPWPNWPTNNWQLGSGKRTGHADGTTTKQPTQAQARGQTTHGYRRTCCFKSRTSPSTFVDAASRPCIQGPVVNQLAAPLPLPWRC
jgi:hypothetical protein